VQFVLFAELLSLIRAFRPYPADQPLKEQEAVLVTGLLMGTLAVAVALGADVIALLRHTSVWRGSPAGYELLTLASGLFLLAAFLSCFLLGTAQRISFGSRQPASARAVAVSLAAALTIALYPEHLRYNFVGELFTVLVGLMALFLPVWALGTIASPSSSEAQFDAIDDIAVIHRALVSHLPFVQRAAVLFDRVSQKPVVRETVGLLNPRQNPRKFAALFGILIGGFLVFAELAEGGGQLPLARMLLVAAVYIGLESAGLLVGYALLAKPLGLFRPPARRAY